MTIAIRQGCPDTAYAAGELKHFLEKYTNAVISDAGAPDAVVSLETETGVPAYAYTVHGDGGTLVIKGADASSVYCGVCDALSEAGILFEATGNTAPTGFDLNAFLKINKDVSPRFRLRGVRQHINFPMDISSYSLKEAKEYLRNIARMRFNAITFHTYPGQWHAVRPGEHAGHFFYGQTHPVPKNDPLTASRIDNRRIFCIPEAEAIYDDGEKRGEFAAYWLNELMKTAKQAGMAVTLSVEIRSDDVPAEQRMLHTLCETYPLIDTLELITEENAADQELPSVTRENVKSFLLGLFGESVADANGEIPGLDACRPGRCGANAVCLKRTLRLLETRDVWLRDLAKKPALRAGLYITDRDTLCVLRPVLRRFLPEGVTMSLLPAHGSLAAAENIKNTGTTPQDWQNTMFYTWAEFDGNMYLHQLSAPGIEALCALPPTASSYGFCINHWRTAENSLTIAYAAEAAVSGLPLDVYYRRFAARLGVSDAEGFAALCTRMARLDTYCRDHLFNIGFCAVGCWLAWHKNGDYMTPRGYDENDSREAMTEYEAVAAEAGKLLPFAETKEAAAFLRLFENRCRTSFLHIRSMLTLEELNALFDFDRPAPLSPVQKEKIRDVLLRSRRDAEQYLHLYGEILPDRGGEGQLVSYYETTLTYIDAVIAPFFGGSVRTSSDAQDAPPMPDADVK